VLPIALLISLLFTLGKLHRANELTAMRAAGVGFGRLMAPIWLVGLLCCGLTWWLNTTIVPWSVERAQAMRDALQFRQDATKGMARDRIGMVHSVAFDNRLARRMWFFNSYSKAAQRGYGVSVTEMDPQRRDIRRLVAAEAWRDPARGWVFTRGRELTYAPETGEMQGSKPFTEFVAEKYPEDPDLMLLIDRKANDLSINQLRRLIDHLEVEHSPKVALYAVRYFGLIADTLGPLVVIAIAIPFAVAGVRVNPAVGVSKSIGLFFLYYVLSNFALSLATRGLVDPMVAAWLPNLGMSLLAAWVFARLR
jgi:lipopolysaccharide export system permease protein